MKLILPILAIAVLVVSCGKRESAVILHVENESDQITNTPLHILLEPIQAEAHRRGDNDTAAAINFLQAAIVDGKQREFADKVAPPIKGTLNAR